MRENRRESHERSDTVYWQIRAQATSAHGTPEMTFIVHLGIIEICFLDLGQQLFHRRMIFIGTTAWHLFPAIRHESKTFQLNKILGNLPPDFGAASAADIFSLGRHLPHSHSIVLGGFELMSYTTRFTPFTSLMIRLEILASTSCGKRNQSAVMPSILVTARIEATFS